MILISSVWCRLCEEISETSALTCYKSFSSPMDPNSSKKMEEQIQTPVASVEELTRQSKELRQRSDNVQPRTENREQQSNNEENSRRKDHSDGTEHPSRMEEELRNMKK